MSGSLRVLPADTPVNAHDHVDLLLSHGRAEPARLLRFNDPRRFGCLLWQPRGQTHELLRDLGPEPLSDDFDGDYLFERSRGRSAPVKTFLMDQRIVVGVGNIYVAEALFAAGISPLRAAGRVSRDRYQRLADAVRAILAHAIARGGTTLRDFISPDGAPGYFEQELAAYGRGGAPCPALRTCAEAGGDRAARDRLVRALPALSSSGPNVREVTLRPSDRAILGRAFGGSRREGCPRRPRSPSGWMPPAAGIAVRWTACCPRSTRSCTRWPGANSPASRRTRSTRPRWCTRPTSS